MKEELSVKEINKSDRKWRGKVINNNNKYLKKILLPFEKNVYNFYV